jgi:CHAD domain-containing protein
MGYRLGVGESVQASVRRIAREQLDKGIAEVTDPQVDRHEVVHQLRKRCKKIRGLIRLVRPQFEATYKRENAWYREAARRLSSIRDAQSVIETWDQLVEHFQDALDREVLCQVRQQLVRRRREVTEDEVGLRQRFDEFLERMHQGRQRVGQWQLKQDDFPSVRGGLARTYARGCNALEEAYRSPSSESFHEWRKRVKYHWYHMRLLRPVWKAPLKARRDEADLLSDLLGDDHDLSVLRETMLRSPDRFGSESTLQAITGLINRRQVELRETARTLGERLFAEKPKRFVQRVGRYWRAWQDEVAREPQLAHKPELVTR